MSVRPALRHDLKCWPDFFDAVQSGAKPFEVRRADRDFQVGDELLLREWRVDVGAYTGRFCVRRITYILRGGEFGIAHGFVVLGLAPEL